jgi:hypothetical protein
MFRKLFGERHEKIALKAPRERNVVEMNGVKFDTPQTVWSALAIVSRRSD